MPYQHHKPRGVAPSEAQRRGDYDVPDIPPELIDHHINAAHRMRAEMVRHLFGQAWRAITSPKCIYASVTVRKREAAL